MLHLEDGFIKIEFDKADNNDSDVDTKNEKKKT
jgi:hypothetical protein